MLVGLYPIAAKPYHAGHHMVMKRASEECDKVILIISLLDRDNIFGSDMAVIWRDHIVPTLPENVSTIFLESSPVSRVYKILGLRNGGPYNDYSFRVYSDSNDMKKNFDHSALTRACPNIVGTDALKVVGIPRCDTIDISGTTMRKYLREGDCESFLKYIPEEMDGQAIFDRLATFHEHTSYFV